MRNRSVVFKKVPDAMPIEDEHLSLEERTFDLQTTPPENGLVLQNLYFSFDPYQRGRMRDSKAESYPPAYELGEPIKNSMISKVLTSAHAGFAKDDLIIQYMSGALEEYTILNGEDIGSDIWRQENPYGLDPALFLGSLGMPGLTAYTASGAVGSLVGQLAKRQGLKVIGSVGDDEKLDYLLKDLEFDGGFNYRKEDPMTALPRLAPDGIDIYFENVGGRHLEAALVSMRLLGRTVICGMIADYNKPFDEKYGVKNLQVIFEKRLSLQGFIVADLRARYHAEHQRSCQAWIAEGSLKGKLSKTIGIEYAIQGLLGLFEGRNFGKAVLQIAEDL